MRRLAWWLGLGILAGCGVGLDRPPSSPTAEERWALRGQIGAARTDLSLRILVDSIPATLATLPPGPVAVVGPAEWDLTAADAVRQSLEALWSRAVDSAAPLRLVVWLYQPRVDSAALGQDGVAVGEGFVGSLWPEATDGRSCVLVLPMGPRWDWDGVRGRVARALGPCVFRARFGRPGGAMADWLRVTGYSAASSLRWFRGQGPDPAPTWYGDGYFHGLTGLDWLRPSMLLFAWRESQGELVPYSAGPAAVRCAAGYEADCRAAVLAGNSSRRPSSARPPGVAEVRNDWYGWEAFRRSAWISDLIRMDGEAKFRTWWRTESDLATGFQATYGTPIGRSARDFTKLDWEARGEAQPIRLGTTMAPGTVATVAVWLTLFLALPLLAARRRNGRP